MRPLVTIGITAYNAADTVIRAIDSAFSQTWRPIEIIVVDDASSDTTPIVLDRQQLLHNEITVLHLAKNIGAAGARNAILERATGEFVAFFDDDDESVPHRVEMQVNRIESYEQRFASGAPVICHAARMVHYPSGEYRIHPTMGQRLDRAAPSGLGIARRVLAGTRMQDAYGACPTCSQMARRSTYALVSNFDPELRRSEDTDLNIRLAKIGAHFVGIAEPLVVQSMTSASDKSLASEHYYMKVLAAKHRDVFTGDAEYHFVGEWLDMKHAWLAGRHADVISRLARVAFAHPALTLQRAMTATDNFSINRAFGRFHRDAAGDRH